MIFILEFIFWVSYRIHTTMILSNLMTTGRKLLGLLPLSLVETKQVFVTVVSLACKIH